MKSHKCRRTGMALILAGLAFASLPVPACTIFVLTDTNRALFCNNEDWSDPKTRIWFQPAGEGCFGAVYVGFDNGYAQGGMNTEGLAFDWVAGFTEKWELDPKLPEGYEVLSGLAIAPGEPAAERSDYKQVFLFDRLQTKLLSGGLRVPATAGKFAEKTG